MNRETKVHVFEKAGLGKAPFQLVGIERKVGPIQIGPNDFVGAPGQPMGSCDFCGNGIAECCVIQDSQGKKFIVGNVCVGKTGDYFLIYKTRQAVRDLRNELRHKREEKRILEAKEMMKNPEIWDLLSADPHPSAHLDWAKRLTLWDWVEWMMSHAGNSGMIRAAKVIEKSNSQIGKGVKS